MVHRPREGKKLRRRVATASAILCFLHPQILRGDSPADSSSEFRALEAAAQEGDLRAAEIMGETYLSELNFATARNWFERAAKNGLPHAQWRLGEILKNGTPAIEGISVAVKADPTNALHS